MQEFHWLRPEWLFALLPLPWWLWQGWRRGRAGLAWQNVCSPHLLPHLLVGQPSRRGQGTLWLFGLGWMVAVLALAGPTWSKLPQPLYKPQDATVLVLDLSLSMNAADLSPSRLARAKYKLLDILKRSGEGQTALLVYAGDAHTVSPLTNDAATIAALVPALDAELMPVPGSNTSQALRRAAQLLRQSGLRQGRVLLVSDGADADAATTARELRAQGYQTSVLAVGTVQGAPVPLATGGYLQDHAGAIVMPRLEVAALQAVAAAGGGRYAELSADSRDLDAVLIAAPSGAAEESAEPGQAVAEQWQEQGPWLVLALLPLAALAFRRGGALAVLLALSALHWPQPARALSWDDLWARPDQRGAAALEAGQAAQAAELFQDPAWRGSAHYRAGDYAQAAEDFAQLDSAEGHYNRGNALAKQGSLEEALAAYKQALQRDPGFDDAKTNLEHVEALLKQQPEPPPADSQPGQDSDPGQEGEQEGEQGQSSADDSQPGQGQDSGQQQGQEQGQEQGQGQDQESAESSAEPSAGQDPAQDAQSQAEAAESPQDPAQSPDQDDPGAQAGDSSSDADAPPSQADPREPAETASGHSAEPAQDEPGEESGAQALTGSGTELPSEEQQALESWLQRIPDDPGGLLRRKFAAEQQNRARSGETAPTQETHAW